MSNKIINNQTKKNISEKSSWIRLLYMLVALVCLEIARVLFFICVAFQFLSTLLTRKLNKHVFVLSKSLRLYINDNLRYLSYFTEKKPYPFSSWPTRKRRIKKTK